MLLIQLLTRPFRNHLGRPKKYHPKGSIELETPKSVLATCTATHRTVCDINVYDIVPKKLASTSRRIYYFGGGGWQSPPSPQHWQVCAKYAMELPGTIVTLVSYPLAPNNPAPSAFPMLMKLYRTIMEEADEAGEKVILAGDSSGGNIVLSLVLEALREDEKAAMSKTEQKRIPHPVAVLALCPSTDLTRNNPDIEKLAKFDPLLTPTFVRQTARAWHADWDPADRRVSPNNADISLLGRSGIKVHGITSGYDILSPDAIIFRDKLAEEGVQGEWLHWVKQMHCFSLTLPYGLLEAREAFAWIVSILKEV